MSYKMRKQLKVNLWQIMKQNRHVYPTVSLAIDLFNKYQINTVYSQELSYLPSFHS